MVNGVAEVSPVWLKHDFRVVGQLHKKLILGIDWLQHFNPVIDWVKYEVTLPIGFVLAAVPVTTSPLVE